MSMSPCNTLNVKTLRISQLASSPTINSNDLLMISHYDTATNVYYSNKTTVGNLSTYLAHSGAFTGSFTGSFKGKSSGSFSGSHYGSLVSKNTKASGSFSGSFYGSVLSKNTKVSGSFSGSFYGSLLSKNTKASGSFSGSHYGKIIGSNGSLITGSFRGIDNITNFKGTGKKVSFNGTASYSVSSSFANQSRSASYADGGSIFSNVLINGTMGTPGTPAATGTDYIIGTLTVPAGKTLKWFKIEGSVGLYESQQFYLYGLKINVTLITTDVYSSWGWGNFSRTGDESDNDFGTRCHFTIEGKPTSVTNSGTLVFYVNGSNGQGPRHSGVFGYAVGYY